TLRQNFGPEIFLKEGIKRSISCPSCYLPCKEIYRYSTEKTGEKEKCITFASSFIGRVTAFGARCDVGTISRALECHELCSRLGLDTYSVSAAIDYVFKLNEEGLLEGQDIGDLDLSRGYAATMALIEQVAFRKGFGAKLADGFKSLGGALGTEFESQIKGTDYLFDARNYRLGTYEFEQVVNPRGGHQHAGGSPTYGSRGISLEQLKKFCRSMSLSDSEMKRIFNSDEGFNVARLTKHCEDYYTAYSLLGVCSRKSIKAFYNLDTLSRLYASATGFDISPNELKLASERVWNLLKMLNVAEGFDRKKDRFPASWFEPMKDGDEKLFFMDYYGKKQLTMDDLKDLLNDYYEEHNWSLSHGVPTLSTAKKLDLEEEWHDLALND
ncbi:MAG: aldehyde ferredoxin oxidoreductase C-terminal domain-containing protein, partial [Deltaproteobacteria bacterium]|nr:aldehyde ferredoxin oxidoreductase C-terminal domain-containing protein [Deltaproteobacteria bacterium]